ncbi:MAG: MFS transporter [Salinibacterium sp.]|nr:MFS transporter [Salinibacterium sp.]
MWFRRALYFWQFAAVLALPVWVFIARGILGSSLGWDLLLFVFLCPLLAVSMVIVVGLTVARKAVRSTRSVSWLDAAVLVVWHGAIITFGFVDTSGVAVLVVVAAIAAFWIAIAQLVIETRDRVRGVMAGFEEVARADRSSTRGSAPIGDGDVIIVYPSQTRAEP